MGGYRLPLEQGPHFFGPTVARVFAVFALYWAHVVFLGTLNGATTPGRPTRTAAVARTCRASLVKTISGEQVGGMGWAARP
jgi:hypothetical protein